MPRFAGEHVYSSNEANIILNRDTGHAEGTTGGVAVFTPLVSADTPWVWQQQARWQDQYVRRYVDAKLTDFEGVPDAYHARSFTESAASVRSFGHDHKADVMLGAEANVRAYVGLDPNVVDARIVRDYAAARVPTSDTRVAPYVQLRFYENRFVRLHDVALLGLFEDYRVGYDVSVRAYPVTRAAGSSRDFVGVDAFAQYVLPIADGYARASTNMLLEATTRDVPTAFYAANVALVSPRFFAGRIVLDALALARPNDYPNLRSVLGGDTRLRGYPSGAFLGENLVVYNAELRSRPLEIFACELGGAAFFDVGDAFDGRDLRAKSSAGVGLRAMFPQIDRRTWRFDVAVPMVRAGGAGPVAFYLAFEQAFPTTIVTPPSAFPTQSFLNPTGGALGQ
jgi:hypothetical protein